MKKEYDYIIVGQGLAGSILTFTLQSFNKRIVVIDEGLEKSSSKVAAGIINSLVLKRLTKSWRADEFSSFSLDFYQSLEKCIQNKIYYPMESYKLISSEEEENYWHHRLKEENLKEYMFSEIQDVQNNLINYKRAGKIKKVAILDVMEFLTTYREHLKSKDAIKEENFNFNKIEFLDKGINYKNLSATKIIFCEGFRAFNNPYFNWLPFSLNKGELISLEVPHFKLSKMLNKNCFILPKSNDIYSIGSTNEWKNMNCIPTYEKKMELIAAFKKICPAEYKLIKHEAGIRPATRDRRPFIGIHPKKKQLAIFNGMGAKAALMAPLLAKEFVEHIEKSKALNKECSIARYLKLYKIDSIV